MGAIPSYFLGHGDEDVVDPATGLTARQKRLAKETWNIFRANSVHTGVTIMTNYFRKYPKYQDAFPAFKGTPVNELSQNRKFQAHCLNIVSTLSNAFDALDDASLMDAVLHVTGERHGARGQGRQEFIDLKGVIMSVFREALGTKFTPEMEDTWDKVIDVTFSKIFQGMDDQIVH